MRILFFIHDLGQGGAEKVLVNLVNNMNKEIFDIHVISIFGGGINEKFLSEKVHYSSIFPKEFPANSKILKLFTPKFLHKWFIKEKFDIEVSYLEGPTARIVSGCTDKDTKLVSWIHCRMQNKNECSVGFRNYHEAKLCYSKFDYTVCVSEWVMNYFTKSFEFTKPIGVLYNTNESDEIKMKSQEMITDVVFEEDCFNICSVGKISNVKGFDRLVKIHKQLLEDNIKNHIYIFGKGEDKNKLESCIAEKNLSETFTFMGYKTNPYKYVKNCDLYVCSSRSEGFSTSVTESLIVGTPVVTTLCSGMKEMLGENNEYGIVTENDEDALYEGIKKMLTTEGLLEYYSEKALERGKKFSTEKTVKAVENMLLNL